MSTSELTTNVATTSRQINVLLIDDDSHDAYVTQQHLKRIKDEHDYVVREVAGLSKTLSALRTPFDVCLLDINLGAFSAFDVLGQIDTESLSGPIILLTGDDTGEHVDTAQLPIIADYLHKPEANSSTLARSIRYAIRDFRALKRLEFLARHDALTGLYMRSHFNQQLHKYLTRVSDQGDPFAVFYIDLDGFKSINDQHGHDVGDEVIKLAASRLKKCFRSTDVVGRYGGDEFVAIVDVADETTASRVGRKVLNTFRSPIRLGDQQFHCTASIGIVLATDASANEFELMRRADHAMYLAKRAGKDTLRVFSAQQDSLSPNSLSRGDALRKAVLNNDIALAYQPLFSIRDNTVLGAEALLRWNDETHGSLPVDQVLLLAAELSLTRELDRAVLESVGRDMTELQAKTALPESFLVTVNIEPTALIDIEFAPFIKTLIHKYPVLKGRLALEVVERSLLPDHHEILSTLEQIKNSGVPILIDDFGTGHSALSYLAKLPISGFKLDKEFIADLAQNPRAKLLVEGVISLGRELDLMIITEGIETQQQVDILKKTDAVIGQGYHFAADLPVLSLVDHLEPAT